MQTAIYEIVSKIDRSTSSLRERTTGTSQVIIDQPDIALAMITMISAQQRPVVASPLITTLVKWKGYWVGFALCCCGSKLGSCSKSNLAIDWTVMVTAPQRASWLF
jgi:hypothetical protein